MQKFNIGDKVILNCFQVDRKKVFHPNDVCTVTGVIFERIDSEGEIQVYYSLDYSKPVISEDAIEEVLELVK